MSAGILSLNVNTSMLRKSWWLAGLAVLMMLWTGPALAEKMLPGPGHGIDVWTVYGFGNAQAVSDVFRALYNFTSSGVFKGAVGFIAVVGVIAVGMTSGFSPAVARTLIGYIVGVFVVCYVFFGVGNNGALTVQIEVYDSATGDWKAPVTVPAVVGIPASVMSTAGHDFTTQVETSFPIPDELKMSKGAPFNLAAAFIADASKARITDPNFSSSLAYYVQDCFTISVARGEHSANELLTSTDFLNSIRTSMKAVYVTTLLSDPVGVSDVVACDVAWTLIRDAVEAQGGDAASYLNNASAWTQTAAVSVLNSSADAVAMFSTNNGITDGAAMVKQAAVLSSFTGAYKNAAAATGSSEVLTAISMATATESQLSGWIVGAEIFNRMMGYVFAVLQVFVYAVTPLVLAAVLIPGLGLSLFKNFGQILLWLAIWQPMLAIVNFIVLSMQQADLGGILNNGAGDHGFTLATMGTISEKTTKLRAAAVFVGTMVPALAWALVKGSVDFSSVIGSAVGERFAAQASNSMVTGNYSLNQASMDSFTANKHSIASQSDFGAGFRVANGVGSSETNIGGNGGVVGSDNSRMGVNQSASTGNSDSRMVGQSGQSSRGGQNSQGGGTGGSLTESIAKTLQSSGMDANTSQTMATLMAGLAGSIPLLGGAQKGGQSPGQGVMNAVQAAMHGGKTGEGDAPPANNAQLGAKPQGGRSPSLTLTPQASTAGSVASTHTAQSGNSVARTGQAADTSNWQASSTAMQGATDVSTAGGTQTTSRNGTMTVSSIASHGDRIDAYRAAMLEEGSWGANSGRYADADSDLGRWIRGADVQGGTAALAREATAPQIENTAARVDDASRREQSNISNEARRLEKEAQQKQAAEKERIAKMQQVQPDMTAGKESTTGMVIKKGGEMFDQAKDGVAAAEVKVKEKLEEMKENTAKYEQQLAEQQAQRLEQAKRLRNQ